MDDARRIELVVVDDEPALAELLCDYVQDEDVDRKCFTESKEALAYMIANDKPRLLITDYHMPDMDGIELAETVEKFQSRPMSVVLISGYLVRGVSPDEVFAKLEDKYKLLQKPWRSDISLQLARWLNELKIETNLADHSST